MHGPIKKLRPELSRLRYADFMKSLFNSFQYFHAANAYVERLTLTERNDGNENSSFYLSEIIQYFHLSCASIDESIEKLNQLLRTFEKHYADGRLRRCNILLYRNMKLEVLQNKFKLSNINGDDNEWETVIKSLYKDGDIGYLNLLKEHSYDLYHSALQLVNEYQRLNDKVNQGEGTYKSIRHLEFNITPLTIQFISSMNSLLSALGIFCLIEYSELPSEFGKKNSFNEFIHIEEKENVS